MQISLSHLLYLSVYKLLHNSEFNTGLAELHEKVRECSGAKDSQIEPVSVNLSLI